MAFFVFRIIGQNEDYILPGIMFVCSASSFDEISVLQAYFVLVCLLFLILLLLLANYFKRNTNIIYFIHEDLNKYHRTIEDTKLYIYFGGTKFWQFLNFKLYFLSQKKTKTN